MRYLIPALAALLVAWTPGMRLIQLGLAVVVCNILLWALRPRDMKANL